MIWIGTSGWAYGDWRRRFYPKDVAQKNWLAFYAERFPTVEINNSFYRLPEVETFAAWRKRTPDGFVYAVKASRFITHIKRLREPREPLKLFWERARRLGGKLGPVLFQLPPRFKADPDRLRTFVRALPRSMRAAFEFRDSSWETSEIRGILDGAGAALVLADRAGTGGSGSVCGGWSYIRFHQGGRTRPGYSKRALERWADRIAELPARDVFVYFNNDAQAFAVRDAVMLTGLLRARGQRIALPGTFFSACARRPPR